MPRSKTQAQKELERIERLATEEDERCAKKEARDLAFQRQRQEQNANTEKKVLTKKELRLQKKERKKVPQPSSSLEPENSQHSEVFSHSDASTDITSQRSITITSEQAEKDARKEMETSAIDHQARIVENHSTYCAGLKPVLIRLQKLLPKCTIIPGKISQGGSNCEEFELHFQRATDNNTYKFVARSGHTTQDLLISVPDTEIFTEELLCENVESAVNNTLQRIDDEQPLEDTDLSIYNREVMYARHGLWKEEHQKKDQEAKKRESKAKRQKEIDKHRRILATKDISPDKIDEYTERDVRIILGEDRSRNSMK